LVLGGLGDRADRPGVQNLIGIDIGFSDPRFKDSLTSGNPYCIWYF